MDSQVESLAHGLIEMGIEKGDRVAVWMGNNSVYACLKWALARVGAVLVTLNPGYSLPELVSALEVSPSMVPLVPLRRFVPRCTAVIGICDLMRERSELRNLVVSGSCQEAKPCSVPGPFERSTLSNC
jgi:long-subunit acyl-CoA synthetase (AMP-forming)